MHKVAKFVSLSRMRILSGLPVCLAGALLLTISAMAFGQAFEDGLPAGWVCEGACGVLGVNGVVELSPQGGQKYGYVVTEPGGPHGLALEGVGGEGEPASGSRLRSVPFTAETGQELSFYFNYITSEGGFFSDYAWARLLDHELEEVALLFTARTSPDESTVPGFEMPPIDSMIEPSEVDVVAEETSWSPLGEDSDECWSQGCGHTGWVKSTYSFAESGQYVIEFGVVNWVDELFQSGLAFDGITLDDDLIGVEQFTVTAVAGAGGVVSPQSRRVSQDATATFSVLPDPGFVRSLEVSGSCPQGQWIDNGYETGPITSDCDVQFSFQPLSDFLHVEITNLGALFAGSDSFVLFDVSNEGAEPLGPVVLTASVSPDFEFLESFNLLPSCAIEAGVDNDYGFRCDVSLIDHWDCNLDSQMLTCELPVLPPSGKASFVSRVAGIGLSLGDIDAGVDVVYEPALFEPGVYLQNPDNPSFLSHQSFGQWWFEEDSVRLEYHFTSVNMTMNTLGWSLSGENIVIHDPDEIGLYEFEQSIGIHALTDDSDVIAAWVELHDSEQVTVTNRQLYSELAILDQDIHGLLVQATRQTFRPAIEFIGLDDQDYTIPEWRSEELASRFKLLSADQAVHPNLTFDLETHKTWLIPSLLREENVFRGDMATFNADGSFDTLTGQYDDFSRSWSLSDDGRSLMFELVHLDDPSQAHVTVLMWHVDQPVSISSVLAMYFDLNDDTRNIIGTRNAIPIDEVIDPLEIIDLLGADNALISTVNTSSQNWEGFQLLPTAWFGWHFFGQDSVGSANFHCDGQPFASIFDVCEGQFTFEGIFNELSWFQDGDGISIDRSAEAFSLCAPEEICRHRTIIFLDRSAEGLITGIEYEWFSDDLANVFGLDTNYLITPRLMTWVIKDLPAPP